MKKSLNLRYEAQEESPNAWIIYDHKRNEALGGASGTDAKKWALDKAKELNSENDGDDF